MIEVSGLITSVRNIINEYDVQDDTYSQEVTESLKDFIKMSLNRIAPQLPARFLDKSVLTGSTKAISTLRPDGNYYASIPLPNDCLKPLTLCVSTWTKVIRSFLTIDNPLFDVQFSDSTGISAGVNSPLCFVVDDSDGQIVMAHAVTAGVSETYKLTYLEKPTVDSNEQINISEDTFQAIAYYAASLYLNSVNNAAYESVLAYSTQYIEALNKF